MSATLVMLVAWLFIVWLSGWTQPQPLQQALLAVFPLTFGPLLALTNLPASLLNGFAAARNLLNLLQEAPATSAAIDATQTLNQIAAIQVDHVTFKYPSRDETVCGKCRCPCMPARLSVLLAPVDLGKVHWPN